MHQSDMHLDAQQKESFEKALRAAFEVNELDEVLDKYLQINRRDLMIEYNMGRIELYTKIIEAIDRRGYVPDLLDAVLKERPKDKQLFLFAQQFGVPVKMAHIVQERIIYHENSYIDIEQWIEHISIYLSQVCSIEENGRHIGTGFLIGPNIIMTNYHVVEAYIRDERSPTDIICRFDCRVKADNTVREGVQYRLTDDNWKLAWSPYHPQEFSKPHVEPSLDQLDFALLRLENMPVKYQSQQDIRELSGRNWIKPYLMTYHFQHSTPLHIMHYPKPPKYKPGESQVPLKISIDPRTMLGVNQNRTRIHYSTNTDKGSSGAPCFTQEWDLVALHHAGDPAQGPQYNQGIPMLTILHQLFIYKKLHLLCLDPSNIPDINFASPTHLGEKPQLHNTGTAQPQSTNEVAPTISLIDKIEAILESIEADIEEAQKPFFGGGHIRNKQYTASSNKIQSAKVRLQQLSSFLEKEQSLPSYYPDRGTLDRDISIMKANCEALMEILQEYNLPQNAAYNFSQLKISFEKIKKSMSKRS